MYTNPSNVIKTIIKLLEDNRAVIDKVVQDYQDDRSLSIFEGMRKSLPASSFPSFELEPTTGTSEWFACRSQMPRFSVQMTLTIINDNPDYFVEYPSTLATILVKILTAPSNLQLKVQNEKKFDPDVGLVDTYIQDSFIESTTYNASTDGTIRTVVFDWFCTINEPYPESQFDNGNIFQPTQVIDSQEVP